MLVSDVAIVIACVAFLITQVHLARVAKKLIKKSDQSWAQAHAEISQVKSDVLAEMQRITKEGGGNQLKADIQELGSRLALSFSQFNEHVAKTFDSFGNALAKSLDDRISSLGSTHFKGSITPQEAQAEGVNSRNAKKIVNAIRAQAMTPEVQLLAQFLQTIGYDELADKLLSNPDLVSSVMKMINADAWLRGRMGQFMGGARQPNYQSQGHQGGQL